MLILRRHAGQSVVLRLDRATLLALLEANVDHGVTVTQLTGWRWGIDAPAAVTALRGELVPYAGAASDTPSSRSAYPAGQ